MKYGILMAAVLAAASPLFALEGQIGCHDPATVTECNGKYFSFGTSGNLMSDDGWTWNGNARGPGGGVAPDICKVGDRYLVTAGGVNARWTKSLDPASPDFGYTQQFQLQRGDGSELNAIDSSLMVDPNDGKLYFTVGSYVGYIRVYELDPQTGQKVNEDYKTISINMEGSDMIFQDGWYYLLGNKASCCAGASSGYNIRMGRSKSPKGPFIDNTGLDMLTGAGKLFAAATGRWIGPGHFGRLIEDEGVHKWSCHYEADLDRGGSSVLDIRPLFYKDGWPVAGFNILKETTYKVNGSGGAALQVAGASGDVVITPVPNVGGYPGMPFCKVTVGGKVLAINANKQVVAAAEFTSAPEQLWRLDQLIDGTWRIVPRTISKNKSAMALTFGASGATLANYDYKNAAQHWNFALPGDPKLVQEGKYEIESARSGRALEIAVEGVPVGGGRGGRGGGAPRGGAPGAAPGVMGPNFTDGLIPVAAPAGPGGGAPGAAPGAAPGGRGGAGGAGGAGRGGGGGGGGGRGGGAPVPDQEASAVSANWPTGNIDTRLANYMCQAQQRWTIQPVATAAGYYKIVIAGTERALVATADREVATVPAFNGAAEQLWKLERLDDGTWRVSPKAVPGVQEELSLTTVGTGLATLSKFDAKSDRGRWNIQAP